MQPIESSIIFADDPRDTMRADAVAIATRLQDAGFIAFWAGGCVRDLLCNHVPKDYDIATNALPDQVIRIFPDSHLTGKSFGVVRVVSNSHDFEIATFRADHSYTDGRHPDAVTFSDPPTDAARRDFTINALFYDPVAGRLYDYVEGCGDLKAGIIRAVGDPNRRFTEDHLRLLRAIRFAARLDFTLEPATAAAIKSAAGFIGKISAERIRDELSRILTEAQRPGDAIALLENTGLLQEILPEVRAMRDQPQPPQFHPEGDVLTHTILMLNNLPRPPDLRLALAALLHDVGKPVTAHQAEDRLRFHHHAEAGAAITRRIMERLRYPNDDIDAVTLMVNNHMRFMNVRDMRRATLRTMVGGPYFPGELELHRLDCEASHGGLENYHFLREFQAALAAEPALPKPWVTGHDIIALGVPEGRAVGEWHKKAYERQLEGLARDRDDLLAWLETNIALTQS